MARFAYVSVLNTVIRGFDYFDGREDRLTFDSIRPGSDIWFMSKIIEQRDEFLYRGSVSALLGGRPPYLTDYISEDQFEELSIYNWFQMISDIYFNALSSRMPRIYSADKARNDFIYEHWDMLEDQLEKAFQYASIHGRTVFRVYDDYFGVPTVEAINPVNHFPVKEYTNPNKIVGHILGFPFYDRRRQKSSSDNDPLFDYIQFHMWTKQPVKMQDKVVDINEVRQYHYSSRLIGGHIFTAPDTTKLITTTENVTGMYERLRDPIYEYTVGMLKDKNVVDKAGTPVMIVPPRTGSIANILGKNPKSPLIPVPPHQTMPFYLQVDRPEAIEAYLEIQMKNIFLLAGLNPSILGFEMGKGES